MKILRRLLLIISIGALLATPAVAFWQRQNLYDWWRLRSYQPPPAIVALADASSMSELGRKIFYVNQPRIDNSSNFRIHCSETEQTIILGCYKSGDGIYMYGVTDPRLNGIVEVTAAHEMLHAAYDRLGAQQRERIDQLTQQTAARLDSDRLIKTIEQYRLKDPASVPDELHSILGTEVAELPPELENHYRLYFNDRGKVVGLAKQYESEFDLRSRQVAAITSQLNALKTSIENDSAALLQRQAQLRADQRQLENLSKNDVQAYNQQVAIYNAKVDAYNREVRRLQANIAEFDRLRGQLNQIAGEIADLYKAIDASAAPQQIR